MITSFPSAACFSNFIIFVFVFIGRVRRQDTSRLAGLESSIDILIPTLKCVVLYLFNN